MSQTKSSAIKIVLIIIALLSQTRAFEQTSAISNTTFIIGIDPIYRSNLIRFESIEERDLYLIVAKHYLNIDSTLSRLCYEQYNSINDFWNELHKACAIYYIIGNDRIDQSTKVRLGNNQSFIDRDTTVDHILADANNYHRGFLFKMTPEVVRHSPVVANMIRVMRPINELSYCVVDSNCANPPMQCSALLLHVKF
jgi:hypothetical protein